MFGRRLRELERTHARERAEWARERQQLLDHILLLAGRPPLQPPAGVRTPPRQPEPDPLTITMPEVI